MGAMSVADRSEILRDIVAAYDNLVRAELGDYGEPRGVRAEEARTVLRSAVEEAAKALGVSLRERR